MKKTLLFIFSLLTLSLLAQDIKFDVLSNAGGRISNVNSASFTFGQPFVGSITNGTNRIRQGFQQPSFMMSAPGCMDTLACNYDSFAAIDDSSCVYPTSSTTDITACDSYSWNGTTYSQTGTYAYSGNNNAANISGYIYGGYFNGSYYYLSQTLTSWTNADSICNLLGGHLVTISDSLENNFILNLLPTQASNQGQAWIGLFQNTSSSSYSEASGGWEWVTGETFNYTNWDIGEPNNYCEGNGVPYGWCPGADNYGKIYSNNICCPAGNWNDVYNSQQNYYVLEIPALTNANGCDSTAILNLTINQGDTSYTNITACDSVSWNGTTYDSSGTYSYSNSASNNYSMSFDGNDYVDLGIKAEFDIQDALTVSVWIKPNSDQTTSVIDRFPGVGSGYRICLRSAAYSTPGVIWASVTGTSAASPHNTYIAGQWIHITAVFKNNNYVKLYLNGSLIDEQATSFTFNSYNEPLEFGRLNSPGGWSPTEFFDGLMDDVTMWNVELDSTEIQNYMNCPPTGNESGLVGYWNFEEGSDNTAFDQTSNGNDGTINGATYDTNVPPQSCGLTNANGCDSTAVLNLTINQAVGCMDSTAFNYNPNACYEDSSCVAISLGCTNSLALNYNPIANTDDNTCYYCSINVSAFPIINPTSSTSCDGAIILNPLSGAGPYTYIWSNSNTSAFNQALCNEVYSYMVTDANGCGFSDTIILSNYTGCTDASAFNYDPTAIIDDGTCVPVIYGCLDSIANNYSVVANVDDGKCDFCYAVADIGADTITACDSVLISTNVIAGGSYCWNSLNSLNNGLVAYYPFNGNANDESENGNNGTVNGATLITDRFGNPNSAYSFDGINDKITVINPSILNFTSTFSVSTWFNPGLSGIPNVFYGIISRAGHTGHPNLSTSFGWQIGRWTNDIRVHTMNIQNPLCENDVYTLPINQWYHLVMVFDLPNGFAYSYLNGTLVNTSSCPIVPIVASPYDLRIGVEREGTNYVCGKIDDIGVWNRALNPQEIQTLYNIDLCNNNLHSLTVSTSGWNYVTVTDSTACSATDSVYVHIDICGCTDATAFNYNSSATADDGSCIAVVQGCMDTLAVNYLDSANTDDGSCIYCDLTISNINIGGNLSSCSAYILVTASSTYGPLTYSWSNGNTSQYNSNLCTGYYTLTLSDTIGCVIDTTIEIGTVVLGCTDSSALNYNPLVNTDDGSCTYPMTYVPDDNFEQALINLGYDNILDDSVITANINTVTSLNVSNDTISDLTGIEDFVALTYLACSHNQLTSLDVSTNTALTSLNCEGNQLTSLDVTVNTALTFLACSDNQLTSLDLSNNTALNQLWCYTNQLTSLDVRNGNNTALTHFHATNNPNLYCIDVDDPVYSTANWTNIDSWSSFSSNCNPISGCTDSLAFNYNPLATIDDSSCIYIIPGCTDSTALNYNPSATSDDGSCIPTVFGCMDSTQFNYNVLANTDDGSCIAYNYGCIDSTQFNYNPLANT